MEQRKLIAFGKSTHSITLPKNWITKNKLKKGDILIIEELPTGDLHVSPTTGPKRETRETRINTKNKTIQRIEREITRAYIKDYNIIEVTGINQKNNKKIREILHNLLGLEIIESSTETIVAKTFLDLSNISIEKTIKRIYYNVKTSAQELEKKIKNKKEKEEIDERDNEINRQVFYTIKIITRAIREPSFAKQLNITTLNAVITWHIAECLEKIGDRMKFIKEILTTTKLNKKEKETVLEAHKKAINTLEKSIEACFTKDEEKANKAIEEADKRRAEIAELILTKEPKISIILAYYRDIILYAKSISERVTHKD